MNPEPEIPSAKRDRSDRGQAKIAYSTSQPKDIQFKCIMTKRSEKVNSHGSGDAAEFAFSDHF
jgi:hypothetical protein